MTDEEIQNLITSSKRIYKREPKKGYKIKDNNKRCDLTLKGNNKMKFKVFICQNQTFIENFSIGLCCEIPSMKNSITLVRYNGPHGQIKRNKSDHHPEPHIHYITREEIKSGVFRPKTKNIKITNKYTTFEEGLRSFLQDINIVNWTDYFSELNQGSLFDGH